MWAAIAKHGHQREVEWSTPFNQLPLELIVHIATITKEPSVYYNLVTTYKPFALFAKEHHRAMKSAMAHTIIGTFPMRPCVEESNIGVRYATLRFLSLCSQEHPIEKLSLRRAEQKHCKDTLVDRLGLTVENTKESEKVFVLIVKSRYNILPNNIVECYDDVRLAISIRYKVYLSKYQYDLGNEPLMEGVLAEVWKQYRHVIKSVFYDVNGKICKTFKK